MSMSDGPIYYFDNNATTLSQDGTSLTLKLQGARKIETAQQVLIAYEAPLNNDVPGSIAATSTLSDASGNDLQSFTFNVSNESSQDFTAPRLTGVTNVDPSGQSINIPFSEMVVIENATAAPCNLQSAEFESFVHQRSRRYG